MTVARSHTLPVQAVKAGKFTDIQILLEGPNFIMRRFIMQPDGGMPEHTNTVEHEQYVLQGHARISIDGEEFDVHAGDVVYIPEGVPHWYRNMGGEAFEFLCIIPNKPDEIRILGESC